MMVMLSEVMPLMKIIVVSVSSITQTWLCDGNVDCSDASDEDKCSKY